MTKESIKIVDEEIIQSLMALLFRFHEVEAMLISGVSSPEILRLIDGKKVSFPSLESMKSAYVKKIVEINDYNKTKAAKVLGISRSALYDLLKKI